VNGVYFAINVRLPINDTCFNISAESIIPYKSAGPPKGGKPFAVQNVVILTDGICNSSCSIIAEFMTRQAV
jgi:hypothetical protein